MCHDILEEIVVQVAGDMREEECKEALEDKIKEIDADFYLIEDTSAYRTYLEQVEENAKNGYVLAKPQDSENSRLPAKNGATPTKNEDPSQHTSADNLES